MRIISSLFIPAERILIPLIRYMHDLALAHYDLKRFARRSL